MLLVSACLLGLNTKYNGGNNLNHAVMALGTKIPLIPVCPEQLGGLPTPRPAVEICNGRVLTNQGEDKTKAYLHGAHETLRLAERVGARAALLKARSPSCGNRHIYDGSFSGKTRDGAGLTAALLTDAGIKVFNEEELNGLNEFLKL